MAISALGTANTTIGPTEYADMTQSLAARFKVDGPDDFKPSSSGLTVSVAKGAGFAAGARLKSTTTEQVSLSPPRSGSRWDAVVMRVDWQTPTAKLSVVQGSSSTVPGVVTVGAGSDSKTNRIPGTRYDALVALAKVTAGQSSVSPLLDMRMWGGDGGPYRVTPNGLANAQHLDCRPGTFIATDRSRNTKRLDDDGTWRDVGTASNPWRTWTPTIRFYGDKTPDGRSGGTIAALGTGGKASGRYRVVDGLLDGFMQVTTAAGNQFGTGMLTFDLPLECADWQPDVWNQGHIFFSKANGGDGNWDFPAQCLIKAGWKRAMIWTPPVRDYSNLEPHRSSLSGAHSTGIPFIRDGWSVGDVYTFHLCYPVED